MDADVLAEAVELTKARVPFALATVVWRRGPSSGHVGSKAAILGDGTVRGWLGGACAEPTVVREALASLDDGQARRLFLGAPDELPAHEIEDTLTIPMTCESEGAMEIYLEPFLPAPQIVVIGRSPAVHALTVQARSLGWDAAVIDDGGDPDEHPHPELVRTSLDLSGLGIGPSSAIVVATQGHYDDLALRTALDTDAGYIGVVAAEKRASSLLELLRDQDVDDAQLARVHAPAGLDLGPIDNAEIAVAVLADLVTRRASGQLRSGTSAALKEAVDPICGMTVFVDTAKHHTVLGGVEHWFCSASCLHTFEQQAAEITVEPTHSRG